MIPDSKLYEFAAIIAAIPFIEKVTSTIIDKQDSYLVKLSLIGLALIGLILAMKYDKPFFTFVLQDLKNNKASSRITKNQTIVPYTFIIIFLSI